MERYEDGSKPSSHQTEGAFASLESLLDAPTQSSQEQEGTIDTLVAQDSPVRNSASTDVSRPKPRRRVRSDGPVSRTRVTAATNDDKKRRIQAPLRDAPAWRSHQKDAPVSRGDPTEKMAPDRHGASSGLDCMRRQTERRRSSSSTETKEQQDKKRKKRQRIRAQAKESAYSQPPDLHFGTPPSPLGAAEILPDKPQEQHTTMIADADAGTKSAFSNRRSQEFKASQKNKKMKPLHSTERHSSTGKRHKTGRSDPAGGNTGWISSAATQITHNETTIVGIRPTHWNRIQGTRFRGGGASSQRLSHAPELQQRLPRGTSLKAALRQPLGRAVVSTSLSSKMRRRKCERDPFGPNSSPYSPSPHRKCMSYDQQRADGEENRSLPHQNVDSTPTSSAPIERPPSRTAVIATKKSSGNGRLLDPKKMSFRPAFAPMRPQSHMDTMELNIEDHDDQHDRIPANSRNKQDIDGTLVGGHSGPLRPTNTRRQKSGKKQGLNGSGPWTRRLAVLRNQRSNDAMKLQHAGIHRSGALFDLNDPRKRASTHTDITILEDCKCPINYRSGTFGNGQSSVHNDVAAFTVLGYIHRHNCLPSSTEVKDPSGDLKHPNSNVAAFAASFAWISFTAATARNLSLERGAQLRIYDAVIVACQRRHGSGRFSPTNAPLVSEKEEPVGNPDCRHIVICTQLCESYPQHLDPLPAIGDCQPAISCDKG